MTAPKDSVDRADDIRAAEAALRSDDCIYQADNKDSYADGFVSGYLTAIEAVGGDPGVVGELVAELRVVASCSPIAGNSRDSAALMSVSQSARALLDRIDRGSDA